MFDSEATLEQKRYAIPFDVPTRWSSTYKMLQFACTHEKQLKAFLKNVIDTSYQGEESTCMKYKLSMSEIESTLTKKAWDDIKIITGIVGFFASSTTTFSEAKANSENVLLSFYYIDDFLTNLLEAGTKAHENVTEKYNLKEINEGILPMSIRKAVDASTDKASEYYNFADQLEFTFICSILDPRSKDRVIKRNLGDHLTLTEIVQRVEDNLVRHYNCLSEESEVIQDSGCIEKADDDEVDLFTEMLQEQFSDIGSPPTSADSVVQEFRRYLAEDRLQMANFDILKYWQSRSSNFPRLARLAKMFYSIPSSSVTKERSFIVARSVIGAHRHNLLAQSLSTLMFPHTNKSLVKSSIKDGKWL
jgi:hypothetical protein